MVDRMSLLLISLEPPSHGSHFAPETVPNPGHRSSESLRNFLPLVARTSERQDRAIPLAQFSHDVFQFQSRIYLAAPVMVYYATGQFHRTTSEFKPPGPSRESPKRPREGQQEQSVLWR